MNEEILQQKAQAIQQECHRTVEYIKSESENFNYQDATNVFIFTKLAELELKIEELTLSPSTQTISKDKIE